VVKLAKRKDVTQLVNACDAGARGADLPLIEQYAFGGDGQAAARRRRRLKPVRRLWLQSMTPQAIREGFERLRTDKQMEGWRTRRAPVPRPTGWSASTARAR
jgi:DNA topoisomerase-3